MTTHAGCCQLASVSDDNASGWSLSQMTRTPLIWGFLNYIRIEFKKPPRLRFFRWLSNGRSPLHSKCPFESFSLNPLCRYRGCAGLKIRKSCSFCSRKLGKSRPIVKKISDSWIILYISVELLFYFIM